MRIFSTALLLLAVASGTLASELGHRPPPKTSAHVLGNPVHGALQGGDTVDDATVIATLPFSDTGATCQYEDDYDEVCPFGGSTSPDVVYSYQVTEEFSLTVDLCGSGYDTKVYIYDESLSLIACNDDFYFTADCGFSVSKIEDAVVAGGQLVYIVIDGYSGDCGEYVLEVRGEPYVPCILACPAGAELEGEPELVDGYQDTWNSGCEGFEFDIPFQELCSPNDSDQLVFCGVSGWYDDDSRDTDWFMATFAAEGSGVIELLLDAERGTVLYELFPRDCETLEVAQTVQIEGGCDPRIMTVTGAPGDPVWLWVGPASFYPPAGFVGHEYHWLLEADGLKSCATPVMASTWSAVKDLYR